MGTKRNGKRDVVEGFRVLTLQYNLNELPLEQRERLVKLFREYRAVTTLYFWSKKLGLEESAKQALERAEELPSYRRKALDEGSPLYAFSEVEKMARPRKHVLKLPLTDALHPNNGAHIDEEKSKLMVHLGDRKCLGLPLPERALCWLKKKEDEVKPLKVSKTVRIQWREDKNPEALKVQIILKVKRPRPPRPDPKKSVLCFVDINSAYGVAVVIASFDGERVCVHETLKLRPPNRGRRLKEAARQQRAAAHGSKPNVNYALARLTTKFDSEGWKKKAIAEIFKRALKYAKGKSIWMIFDIPDLRKLRNSYLQKTLSVRKIAENLANWYGVYITFRCYSLRRCPICGREMEELKTTRTRIVRCECGFYEDRDYIPFHHWLK